MARNDSESGRKTPDHLAQMIKSTSDDGNVSPFSSDWNDSVVSTPSIADEIFSPSASIVTDITEEYGWETPVKGKSTTRQIDSTIIESPPSEAQYKLKETEDCSKQDTGFNTHVQPPASRRTRSASSHELKSKTSSIGSLVTSVASFHKRKPVPESPTDTNALDLGQRQIWKESNDLLKSKTPKRLRQTEFWTLELNKQVDLDFFTDKSNLIKARLKSDVGGICARKLTPDAVVLRTEKKQNIDRIPPRPASQSIPDIILSTPEITRNDRKAGDAYTSSSKNILLGDGTIKHVLSLLSDQAFSASSSANEQKSIEFSLSKIIPIEIRERLEEDTHRCPAWTIKGLRCKRIHNTNHPKMIQYLDNITKIKSSELPKYLDDMIVTALCSATHRGKAREELEKWMVDIEKLCEIHADSKETRTVSVDNRLLALANWIDILSGGKGFSKRANILSSSPTQPKVEKSDPSVATSQELRLIQYFEPYINKKLQNVSVPEALEGLLLKPLTGKRERQKVGVIYVYWQPANFGHLKIGYTTDDVEERLKEWSNQCRKTMELYFPLQDDVQERIPVKHVYRVEKLIHTELKNLRRIEQKCPGCGKNHEEWFEVPKDLAVAVVRKWMAWMRESPYEEQPGEPEEWVLKAEQRSKIKALSEPTKGVSVTAQAMEKGWNKHPRQARRLSTGRLPRTRSKSM